AGDPGQFGHFLAARGGVAPGIDAVNRQFAAAARSLMHFITDVADLVRNGSRPIDTSIPRHARLPFERYEEECGRQPFVGQRVVAERLPEVVLQPERDQRQRRHRRPVAQYIAEWPASTRIVDERPESRASDEAG